MVVWFFSFSNSSKFDVDGWMCVCVKRIRQAFEWIMNTLNGDLQPFPPLWASITSKSMADHVIGPIIQCDREKFWLDDCDDFGVSILSRAFHQHGA